MPDYLVFHVWYIRILQFVINDGCLAQSAVVELTAKARKLIENYKNSNVAPQCLLRILEQLGLSQKRLMQDEITRWSTTYYMLERLSNWTKSSNLSYRSRGWSSFWINQLKLDSGWENIKNSPNLRRSNSGSNWQFVQQQVSLIQWWIAQWSYLKYLIVIMVKWNEEGNTEIIEGTLKPHGIYYAIATLLDPTFTKQNIFIITFSSSCKKMLLVANKALEDKKRRSYLQMPQSGQY